MAFEFGFSQVGIDPPKMWQIASRSFKFFFASSIATINATEWISDPHKKMWSLILGLSIVACQALDMFLGEVVDASKAKTTTTQLNS